MSKIIEALLQSAIEHRRRIFLDDIDCANLLAGIDKLHDLLGKANALCRIRAERIAELEPDAARYQFIRAGNVYVEPNGEFIYVAIESGKYYKDLRDLDMDIDEAISAFERGDLQSAT